MDRDKRSFVGGVLVGLAIFVTLNVIFLWFFMTANANNEKQREMTTLCVEQGYVGWVDGYDRDTNNLGCITDEAR